MTTHEPTAVGSPRSRGSSRWATEAKNASTSACRTGDTNTCSHAPRRKAPPGRGLARRGVGTGSEAAADAVRLAGADRRPVRVDEPHADVELVGAPVLVEDVVVDLQEDLVELQALVGRVDRRG